MSLLTIVQNACNRIGVTPPTAVYGASDQQTIQMLALANKEARDLAQGQSVGRNFDWAALQTEAIFTTIATESQGLISTIAPGFRYIINDTIWNRSLIRPVRGALTPQDWQLLKSSAVKGPWNQYRIHGGQLQMIPNPAAGQVCAFEYQSAYCITDSTGAVLKPAFTADSDAGLLDETLLEDGLVWRWKQARGFDYAQDFMDYQARVLNAMSRDGGKPHISMAQGAGLNGNGAQPFLLVPEGSWAK